MFHVLWFEHLLSLFIPHHSSILLFHLILCLFISSLFYSYSYRRLSFLYSPSHSTSHFHSFSYQHTLSSLFFYAISFLSFNPFSPLSHSILPHYSTPFSFILSSFFPFIPFHIILSVPFYSHSILHPFPFQHHSPFLFFLSLLHTTLRFDSLLLLSSLFPDSFLLSFSSYISIPFFLIYSRSIYSIHSLLSYPFTHILLSSRLLYSAEELHSNKSKGQLLVQRELGLYLPNCELCITPAPSDWILFLFRLYSVWHSLPSIHSSWPFLLSFWTSPFID